MERVEYTTDGNTIGLSIKYPNEIPRKWSESHTNIGCEKCGSENISSDISGDILTIACHNCVNHWYGEHEKILTWHETEEAFINMRKLPFRDEPDF